MLRRFPEILVLSILATAGALVFVDNDDPSAPPAAQQSAQQSAEQSEQSVGQDIDDPHLGARPDPDDPHTWQTSDQVPGEIARPLVPGQRVTLARTLRFAYSPAPGVTIRGWDSRTQRGPIRYYVTRVKWQTPGVKVDVAHGDRVRRVQTVPDMLAPVPGLVAGTNGDFYDISDTGAPLGIGRARGGGGLLNAIDSGWNYALSENAAGKWHIGELPMVGRVVGHPEIEVTNYNSPRVKVGGTGIYDWRFGQTAGYGWTDGQRKQVRYLRIVDGVVVSNSTSLPDKTGIKGIVLLARGDKPEDRLRAIPVGTHLRVKRRLAHDVTMALTGNALLVKKRQLMTSDDGEMHPRTAVGIDRDTKELIILTVDGRQSFSRGYTMEELATKMLRLGAEDALNLDGGGSTTLAAMQKGKLAVLNSPSDGFLRSVPNGLVVSYVPQP